MESCGDTVIPKEISKEWNTTCESRVSCQGRHLVLPFYFSPGAPCGSIRINSSAYLIALGAPLGVVNLPIRKRRGRDSASVRVRGFGAGSVRVRVRFGFGFG